MGGSGFNRHPAGKWVRFQPALTRGPWRSFEAVEFATLEWVDWFNNGRLLAPIGYIPPAEAEERYYASLDQPAMAAQLKQNSLWQTRGGSGAGIWMALTPAMLRRII
jgi:hypothetical protein